MRRSPPPPLTTTGRQGRPPPFSGGRACSARTVRGHAASATSPHAHGVGMFRRPAGTGAAPRHSSRRKVRRCCDAICGHGWVTGLPWQPACITPCHTPVCTVTHLPGWCLGRASPARRGGAPAAVVRLVGHDGWWADEPAKYGPLCLALQQQQQQPWPTPLQAWPGHLGWSWEPGEPPSSPWHHGRSAVWTCAAGHRWLARLSSHHA